MRRTLAFASWLLMTVLACGSSREGQRPHGMDGSTPVADAGNEAGSPRTYSLGGVAQKGPFIKGAPVILRELGSDFMATGLSRSSNVLEDTGAFEFHGVQLSSALVKLSMVGFYFDEVAGAISTDQIPLEAVVKLTSDDAGASTGTRAVNVNVLTHLEKDRVEYLVTQGMEFDDAKAQAQAEVLEIFAITRAGMASSEQLDLSQGGEDNAVLLALSVIVLGHRTPEALTELLSSLSADIRVDGTLDSSTTRTALVDEAMLLDLPAVRSNVERRYLDAGVAAFLGDFEVYVEQFVDGGAR